MLGSRAKAVYVLTDAAETTQKAGTIRLLPTECEGSPFLSLPTVGSINLEKLYHLTDEH